MHHLTFALSLTGGASKNVSIDRCRILRCRAQNRIRTAFQFHANSRFLNLFYPGPILIFFFFACVILSTSTAWCKDNFRPLQGRWSIGGSASIPWYIDLQAAMGFDLTLTPTASYFVIDGLEVALESQVRTALTANDPEISRLRPPTWGFGGGVRYYFDLGKDYIPYIGVQAGFQMVNDWTESLLYEFGPNGGVLLALTDALVLDIAILVKGVFSTQIFKRAEIVPAVLGIHYYF